MYEYKGNIVRYDDELAEFIVTQHGNEYIYKPQIEVIKEYDVSDFVVKILYNQKAVENSIFTVCCDKSERVGWLFPLQALVSSQHDFYDKEYFLKQAYVANYLVLEIIAEKFDLGVTDDIILTDYFGENCQILILEKTLLNRYCISFSYEEYAPSLLFYGYTERKSALEMSRFDELKRKIHLTRISGDLNNNAYIIALFRDMIPSRLDELSRFHMLYQAVEAMISVIFEYKFKDMLDSLQGDTANIYITETAEDLKNLLAEKERIQDLFGSWSKIRTDIQNGLKGECKSFLEANSFPVKDSLYSCLYGTRNMIVHSMYKLNDNELKKLEGINESFLYVLVDIVNTFAKPLNTNT